LHSPVLEWSGVLVGLAVGGFCAWLFGRLAYRKLEADGPEMLDTLRKGPRRQAAVAKPAAAGEAAPAAAQRPGLDLTPAQTAVLGLLITGGILLLLPQGAVAICLAAFHVPVRSWFVALYFDGWLRFVVGGASMVLGALALWGAASIVRSPARRAARSESPAAVGRPLVEESAGRH